MFKPFFLFVLIALAGTRAGADIVDDVEAIFAKHKNNLNFAAVKTETDFLVDPSISVARQLAQIDQMVFAIEKMLPPNADEWQKIETIRKYIYEAGLWNSYKAFSYDHDDPLGQDPSNRLLANYIKGRKGNCVTMPFLFIILGQRLGLDMKPALAPIHVFVKFTDAQGQTHNLEATSGGGRTRDSHYRKLLPITDRAIESGIFMRGVADEETIAVITVVVVEDLIRLKRYDDALAVSDVILSHYPDYAYALVKRGTAAYYALKTEFYDVYQTAQDIPPELHERLNELQSINQDVFSRADFLGWKPMQIGRQ